jgi:hypothetical protein
MVVSMFATISRLALPALLNLNVGPQQVNVGAQAAG